MSTAQIITEGQAALGIELGSTRIKASLITPSAVPIGEGSFTWENRLVDGIWTYDITDVLAGTAACVAALRDDVRTRHGVELTEVAAIGISGMMHGYVALDANGDLLVPFRTWRNNITEQAAAELTNLLASPIAQRWSIAHLYQAILNREPHVPNIARITTIAGYLHWQLTGEHAVGICEGSGMFPVDPETGTYDSDAVRKFDDLISGHDLPWKLLDIMPAVLPAGANAGTLTDAGAKLLAADGAIAAGVVCCPPEGDAGTGMVATNAVRPRTGNVSAGTSVFAMLVLEKPLSRVHEEIDLVLTPDGSPVAMAHSNNCSSELDAWIKLFGEAATALGCEVSTDDLYGKILPLALEGDPAVSGFLPYGYVSGEHITGFAEGRPLFARDPSAPLTLANFVRSQLMTALGALRKGLDILTDDEGVEVEEIVGHGGFFKTPVVGQRLMAAAARTPISVMETAGEGGAWGMAILAAFAIRDDRDQALADYLDAVFRASRKETVEPVAEDVQGFAAFHERYLRGLDLERAAITAIPAEPTK